MNAVNQSLRSLLKDRLQADFQGMVAFIYTLSLPPGDAQKQKSRTDPSYVFFLKIR